MMKKSKDLSPTKVEVGFNLTQLSSLNFSCTYITKQWQITAVYGEQHISTKKITVTKTNILRKDDESCTQIIQTMKPGPFKILVLLQTNKKSLSFKMLPKMGTLMLSDSLSQQFHRTALPSCQQETCHISRIQQALLPGTQEKHHHETQLKSLGNKSYITQLAWPWLGQSEFSSQQMASGCVLDLCWKRC